MQHDQVQGLGGGGHEQVGYLASALATGCQLPLDLSCPLQVGGCRLDQLERGERLLQRIPLSGVPGGVSDLEVRDSGAAKPA